MSDLLLKYKAPTQTIRNGEPMPYWDAFLQWAKEVHEYFQTVKDYKGYPKLPDFWQDGFGLYEQAPEADRKFIAHHSQLLFIEAMRHWKTDADALSPGQERTLLPLG